MFYTFKINLMKINTLHIKSLLFFFVIWLSSSSHADMLLSPTRVLMDNENRSASMILRNPSTGSRTYRLSWQDKRSNIDGSYTPIGEEDWPSSAKNMLRFSPRQITVGPGENQTVRFSWRPPADLPIGEYRSHLFLQVIPDISEPSAAFDLDGPEDGIGVQVFMQMSFSIPVVVRNNTDIPQITIKDVKAVPYKDEEKLALNITFSHTGNASSFGKLLVEMQRDSDSPVELIGQLKELSIYPELDTRTVSIPLQDSSIPSGALVRVAYEGLHESEGILWAERVFKTD